MKSSNPDVSLERGGMDAPVLVSCDLEQYTKMRDDSSPIFNYTKVLGYLRKKSQSIENQREEVEFALLFKEKLNELSELYNLADDHFSIDTSGSPLLIKELGGEHLISPTHFECGAYFSHPHADHQMSFTPEQLPKIKIGKYVRFGRNSSINAGGDITIGDGVWLSPGSQLLRQNHDPYGRPSVGARSVAMTTLPAITLSDYAWIGRESMVGWAADYIGKASIVATKTFVNSWVGDYSIVGDRGKILQYMPFKAYLLEHKNISFREIMAINNWSVVNDEWLDYYRNKISSNVIVEHMFYEDVRPEKNCKALIINPSNINGLSDFLSTKLDIIAVDRNLCASALQWCLDHKYYGLRFRGDLQLLSLPFPTGGYIHYRKDIGYSFILCHISIQNINKNILNEVIRVAALNAKIILRKDVYELIKKSHMIELSDEGVNFSEIISYGNEPYVLLKKQG
ncbi:acyltransferase [Citrobacter koseri]|uniref:acyltransferase n=1 Tax=Citrobacter koseri TaxID=545 RepID=UPI0028BD4CD0|nr:hypothetical protein [Citrobacter koseri]MDT7459948.1 hypothetical protein [Citrobacter koseri]